MNTSLYIAKRYLFAKSSNNTINIITKIATIGVVISTIALFIVLSAFSGLKSFNHHFLNMADPDVKISSTIGKSFFITNQLLNQLKNKDIYCFSKVIEEHAVIDNNDKRVAITIKGVDQNYLKVNAMDSAIYNGNWFTKTEKNGVVVGQAISYKIAAMPYSFNENLKIYVLKPGKSQVTLKAVSTVYVKTVGVFNLKPEMNNFVFAPIAKAKKLLNYKENQITAIEIKLNQDVIANKFIKKLQQKIGSNYKVQTRYQLNETFNKMLNMENLFAYLIATLIGIIAFFNVIGAIIMMILDKRKNIKTLFNLGLPLKQIKKIFYLQGILLTIFGLVIGLIIAFIVVIVQQKFELMMINANMAYPVEFHFKNLIIVIVTILILGLFAAMIASSSVSKKLIVA